MKNTEELKQKCLSAKLPVDDVWYDELDTLHASFTRSLTADEWQVYCDIRDGATHKEKRAREYPPLGDFADAFYWFQKGVTQPMDEYLKKCDAVKSKYKKEGS